MDVSIAMQYNVQQSNGFADVLYMQMYESNEPTASLVDRG